MNFRDVYCFEVKEIFFKDKKIVEVKRNFLNCHNIEKLIDRSVINKLTESNKFSDFLRDKDLLSKNFVKMFLGEIDSFREVLRYEFPKVGFQDIVMYAHLLERKVNSITVLIFMTDNIEIYFELFDGLVKNKFVGIAVYQDDKIIFSDEAFRNLVGYDVKELKDINFSSLFHDNMIDIVKHLSKVRNNGKSVEKHFTNVPMKTKEGYYKYVDLYDTTIRFKSKLSGCMTFVDVTENKRLKDFYSILHGINSLIFTAKKKDEFFTSVCEYLASLKNIRFVWFGEIDGENVRPIVKAGYEEGFLGKTSFLPENVLKENLKKLKNGQIVFLSDTESGLKESVYKNEMLERKYMSSVYIPILEENDYKYVLSLYSEEPYYYDSYLLNVLKDIQHDISYFLNTVKEIEFKEYIYMAIENSNDWVVVTDKDGKIEYANPAVEKISGFKREELLGQTPAVFKSGLYDDRFYDLMWKRLQAGEVWKGVIINRAKNGEYFQLDHTIIPISKDGEIIRYVSIAKDISKELALEEEIKRFKYFDLKTNSLNRQGFIEEAAKILEQTRDFDFIKAVVVIDVYDFSSLNELLGIEICDKLLKIIADRIRNLFKDNYVFARVGSDEFAVFLMMEEANDLFNLIKKITDAFKNEIKIFGSQIKVNVNIGAAFIGSDEKIEDVLVKSELALGLAKKEGPNKFRFYDEKINEKINTYFEKVNLVVNALNKNWLTFHYQPIFDAFTRKTSGFEALVRINHPEKGLIFPNAFIDVVEEMDLLIDFEKYLFDMIVKQLFEFHRETHCNCFTALNVSVNSFKTGHIIKYASSVPVELRQYLNIEITERVFAEDTDEILNTMQELKNLGFKLEIDDFGTGYSSLSYIERIPADVIKIDMSFVRKMTTCKKTVSIVETIVNLAKGLGLKTVAEGVETKEQYEILKSFGCDFVQGYLFSKPLPASELKKLVVS